MFAVETYAAVRRFAFVEGRSRREAARVFGLSRETPRCAVFRYRLDMFGVSRQSGLSSGLSFRSMRRSSRQIRRRHRSKGIRRSGFMTISKLRWPVFGATASASAPAPLRSSSAITCFRNGLADRGKATTRTRSKPWSSIRKPTFYIPVPRASPFEALNAALEERCGARQKECAGRHELTIGERLVADQV
jgi:hypothetical protein